MKFKNIKDLFTYFHNEDICREYLIKKRWGGGKPVCPYCKMTSQKVYIIEKGKRFKCGYANCRKKFSVTVGTVYENTKIPLSTWFGALYLITAHKKGISSLQLHRDLGVTQKTAWFLLHRIREMIKDSGFDMLKNTVEIDETYVGGKEKNKHKHKRKKPVVHEDGSISRPNVKTPVFGMLERGGKVFAMKVESGEYRSVAPEVYTRIQVGSTLMTDNSNAYLRLELNYNRHSVDHSKGHYASGSIHNNTIEGFWSLFKRGIIGIYHSVSAKHINYYCDEFTYRYNTRKMVDSERFNETLALGEGRRLKYKDLIADGEN